MLSTERRVAVLAARRRGGLHRAGGDRRVGRAIHAGNGVPATTVGRAWIKGREVGRSNPRFAHLCESHD